jgi:hypothetical protein
MVATISAARNGQLTFISKYYNIGLTSQTWILRLELVSFSSLIPLHDELERRTCLRSLLHSGHRADMIGHSPCDLEDCTSLTGRRQEMHVLIVDSDHAFMATKHRHFAYNIVFLERV